jgi:predicted DNA-binding protein
MGPLRKSVSVRLEEGVHARLRRQSLRSGVPTSALVRALIHRWLDEQDEAGEVAVGTPNPEPKRQPGLFGEEGRL